ncbi:MAG: hypothetical protein ABSC06_25120 [Rhodopila sp.]
MSETEDDRLIRLCGCPECGGFASAAFLEIKRQREVSAALERLRNVLVRAFAVEGWPRRLVLPAPRTATETAALDGFVAALRLDLPDLTVVVDPAL